MLEFTFYQRISGTYSRLIYINYYLRIINYLPKCFNSPASTGTDFLTLKLT